MPPVLSGEREDGNKKRKESERDDVKRIQRVSCGSKYAKIKEDVKTYAKGCIQFWCGIRTEKFTAPERRTKIMMPVDGFFKQNGRQFLSMEGEDDEMDRMSRSKPKSIRCGNEMVRVADLYGREMRPLHLRTTKSMQVQEDK